jgi:heme ABC exporter ATP-binding subunit CcmA
MIALESVERRFGERVALSDVSVRVEEGQTLVVFGPNGAGKTTLLRVLAGLLRPHSGEATVLDASLPREAWKLRGKVGYVAHEPLLYRDLTPRENLRFHARLHDVTESRIDTVLDAVGMADRADDELAELSRGMVQRIAVARAVLHDPPLLLLDEPWAGLDPAAVELLAPVIGRASGKTRVVVTHDVAGGLEEADVALGLRDGAGTPAGDESAIRELYR